MKAFLVVFLIGVAVQYASSQCLRSPLAPALSPYVDSSVANSLADTLSLLTVSSLLSEKLPLGYPMAPIPAVAPVAPIAPVVGGLGCGYDAFYNYPYNSYLI